MKSKKMNLPSQFEVNSQLCIHSVFARVANKYPNHIAVVDETNQLTYSELNRRASQFALNLQKAGIQPENLIGLCLPRDGDLIVAILGILKAGAAYVPIDPDYPEKRRDQILTSANINIVVCNAETSKLFTDRKLTLINLLIDNSLTSYNLPSVDINESNLAYIIFTSGSTGQPKGVMIEHGNVLRLFTETNAVFCFNEEDVWCNFHSVAFDFSVWEIWGALLFGGCLVIVPKGHTKDPQSFYKFLDDNKVTVLNQTPSSFRNLISVSEKYPKSLAALRYVIFGGERLDCQMLIPWVNKYGTKKPSLINMYGITETTVHTTWKRLNEIDIFNNNCSPIGTPISDLKLDAVDPYGNSLPIGKEGVIYISGPGLARGYLNRLDLTEERFVYRIDKYGCRERWYNSGDIGIQIAPNQFAYIGRIDSQLKIRGYRIEPSEIENCLKTNLNIQDCVVIGRDYGDGDSRLIAYVVPRHFISEKNELLEKKLRQKISQKLPNFMWPSFYTFIKEIPTTANGKLDKEALLQLEQTTLAQTTTDKNPQVNYSLKDNVRFIWLKILGISQFSDEEEFFDLGGTSFSLIHMLQQVNKLCGTNIGVDVLSRGANIKALLEAINNYLSVPNRLIKE